MHTCTHHSNARAAWICSKCGATLCPACAIGDEVQRVPIIRCIHCGGVSQQIMTTKEIVPYWGMFATFLKALFCPRGLLQVLALGAGMFFLGLMPLIGWALALGLYAGYYFLVITHFAYGEENLPVPDDFNDVWDNLISPFLRFVVATLILWVPALLYIHHKLGLFFLLRYPNTMFHDPVLVVIVILSIVYFPGAMITAAVSESTFAMLNPLYVIGMVVRIPGQYLLTVVVWGMMSVANVYLKAFVALHLVSCSGCSVLRTIFVGVVYQGVGLFIPLMTAMVLGRLVYQNRKLLGFGHPRDLLEPEFPNAKPRGTAPEGGWEKPRVVEPLKPISLDPEEPEELKAARTEPVASFSPQDPSSALRAALQASDIEQVTRAYSELIAAGGMPDLDPPLEMRLANILDRSGDSLGAAHACRRAAARDAGGPLAARAIFSAARLLTEKLGDREQGVAMYRYLVENFPADPLADRAREMLRRLGV